MITLTGPGGVGKTRLALEVAHRVAEAFEDGVGFVDLSPVRDPIRWPAIARVLGVRETEIVRSSERLLAELGRKHRLLVLDNFEQIIEAAPLVSELLAAAPRIAHSGHVAGGAPGARRSRCRGSTIRAPQRAGGVKAIRQSISSSQPRSRSSPVSRFLHRMPRWWPRFAGGSMDCRSPSNWRPPGSGTFHRNCCFPGWDNGCPCSPAVPAIRPRATRHCATRLPGATTCSGLPSNCLFRSMGVFAGGASFEAVEVIALAASPSLDVMAGLASLVDKSLVIERENTDGTPRFSLLETLREFALAALAETARAGAGARDPRTVVRLIRRSRRCCQRRRRNRHGPWED